MKYLMFFHVPDIVLLTGKSVEPKQAWLLMLETWGYVDIKWIHSGQASQPHWGRTGGWAG